jgi:hypothetical protein
MGIIILGNSIMNLEHPYRFKCEDVQVQYHGHKDTLMSQIRIHGTDIHVTIRS